MLTLLTVVAFSLSRGGRQNATKVSKVSIMLCNVMIYNYNSGEAGKHIIAEAAGLIE